MELALAGPSAVYASPALGAGLDVEQRADVVWWAVVVGLAYGIALAWASWCRATGGDPDINFGWTGFKVVCRSRA